MNKIFGIGMPRTGTKSLINFIRQHGYTAIHNPQNNANIKNYKAAADIFVTINWETLAELYPNSKFILTTRDKEDWHRSCSIKFKQPDGQRVLRRRCFGLDYYDRETFENAWNEHNKRITEYFSDKPEKLFILNLNEITEDKLRKLGKFINSDKEILTYPKGL